VRDQLDTPPPIYLHIGPMKTGTTYLQQALSDNKGLLDAHGVLVPGSRPRSDHVKAVRDITGVDGHRDTRTFAGAWASLREEMLAHPGHSSVVSQEFLSFARGHAKSVVRSLAPAQVHIVLTVRDASRVAPASWVTSTGNRNIASWPEHLAALAGSGDRAVRRRALRALHLPRILRAWATAVPPNHLHVVTVPPPGAPDRLLWDRFAAVIGAANVPVDLNGTARRESYGYISADLMRRVNAQVQDMPNPEYHRAKRWLLDDTLKKRTGEPRVPVSQLQLDIAQKWNSRSRTVIEKSRAQVSGDLNDLCVTGRADVEVAELPSEDDTLTAATEAASTMQAALTAKYGRSVVERDVPVPHRGDPVDAAVNELALLMRLTQQRGSPSRPGQRR
jgi:hypothetical protein